jgi:ribonuclease T2
LSVLCVTLGSIAGRAAAPQNLVSTADFDFYVLALSWSPGFCDTGGARGSSDECDAGARKGFVVHGLWPDNQNRADPRDCDGDRTISDAALEVARGVYPAIGLARHEFQTHGTCTGLGAENYFAAVKYARDQFIIPDVLKAPPERFSTSPTQIESAFMAANVNLAAADMAVTCRSGELVEVRFCVTKSLGAFVNCPKVANHSCHSSSISVAAPR